MAEPETPAADTQDAGGTPTVVVSHLDIRYTVLGGDRRGAPSAQGESRSIRSILGLDREARTREIHAVKDVSFVARHGESIGIIGRNGSGKSTLLRAVAGLIPPSAGRIWVAGEPSLLGVNAILMSKLSGERNIYIGAQALGLSKAEIDARYDEIVEFSGIGDAIHLPMSTYSSGMGARLRFAISTAAAPDVLMIDEALATGDADFRAKSAQRIAEVRERAGTVFLVSHSNGTIRQICDRVLWMDRGHLVMDGPTEEVLTAYEATLPKKKSGKKAAGTVKEADVPGTTRWAGTNRFQTAAQITRQTWSPGVGGCFVVSIHRLASARVVTPIAARLGWPIMWVRPGTVPSTTRDDLSALSPERVIIVGGDELINPDSVERIQEIVGGRAERMGADDAATTSVELLRAFPPDDPTTVHITPSHSSGRNPAVSLAAAVAGQAVIACDETGAPPESLTEALAELGPEVLLFSGNEEDWSPETVAALRDATGARVEFPTINGPQALVSTLWDDHPPGGEVMVAGKSAVEFLTASVAAVTTGRALLLCTTDRVPRVYDDAFAHLAPRHIIIAGSPTALPLRTRKTLGERVVTSDEAAPAAGEGADAQASGEGVDAPAAGPAADRDA